MVQIPASLNHASSSSRLSHLIPKMCHAIDMGNFYRVPADKRDLNYDKYFTDGNTERTKLSEFNSNNTELMNVDQVKEKLMTLSYIRDELAKWEKR